MAAVGAMRTTMRQTLLVCPACDRDIEAEVALKASPVDVRFESGIQKQVALNAELVGIRFNHDCLPGAKRGPGRPRGSVNRPKVVDVSEQTAKRLDVNQAAIDRELKAGHVPADSDRFA